MRLIFKFMLLIVVLFAASCEAKDINAVKSRTLSANETAQLLAAYENNGELKQWQTIGIELLDIDSNCPYQRDILIYSKPSLIGKSIYQGNLKRLRFGSGKNSGSSCAKLGKISVYNDKYAIFSSKKNPDDLKQSNKIELLDNVPASTLLRVHRVIGELHSCLNRSARDCKLHINYVPTKKYLSTKLADVDIKDIYTIGFGPAISQGSTDIMVSFKSENESYIVASFKKCECHIDNVSISLLMP